MASLIPPQHSVALQAIVLAGGQSLRFKTGTPKLLEPLCGQAIVAYPVKVLQDLAIQTIVVTNNHKEALRATLLDALTTANTLTFVTQDAPRGTADALACTQALWKQEHILVINGDMPLVSTQLIARLYEHHLLHGADATFVTAHNPESSPEAYDAIKSQDDIIELMHKNSAADHETCCIDAGIYIFKTNVLRAWLQETSVLDNLYCADIMHFAKKSGLVVASISAPFDHVREVNTPQDLWVAQQIKRAEIIRYWMQQGVIFSMPQTVHIDINVTMNAGTRIASGVHLFGKTIIGADCTIGEFCVIQDSTLHNRVTVLPYSVIMHTSLGQDCTIGPFVHLRPGTVMHEEHIQKNYHAGSVDQTPTAKQIVP